MMALKNGFLKVLIKVYIKFDRFLEAENAADSRVFWATNYITPIVWVIFAIMNVASFSLSNAIICLFSCGLSFTNLMGFIKCETNHKQKVQGFLLNQA